GKGVVPEVIVELDGAHLIGRQRRQSGLESHHAPRLARMPSASASAPVLVAAAAYYDQCRLFTPPPALACVETAGSSPPWLARELAEPTSLPPRSPYGNANFPLETNQ